MKTFVETGMKIMGKKAANNPGAIEAAGKSLKDKTSPMKKERLLEGVKARLKKRKEEGKEDRRGSKDGGRMGYKMGSKCKLAMKGKGRAYGKNS